MKLFLNSLPSDMIPSDFVYEKLLSD